MCSESRACGYGQESNYHFFSECPLYNDIQLILYDTVLSLENIDFSMEILLYGSNHFSYAENLVIFDAVHAFIAQSKRFLHN